MFCPVCGGSNPVDARFCMFCATSLDKAEASPRAPVTGPTVRLETPPADTAATPATSHPRSPRHKQQHHGPDLNALFLIGLGVLFLTGHFWPGILFLLGMMGFVSHAKRGQRHDAMQGLVFFGGLALLFLTGLWWPGILLWFGAMSMIGSPRHGWRCW